MKLTARSLPVLAAGLFAAACGSSSNPAQAAVHCDRFAEPGPRAAQRLADALAPGQTGCLRGGEYLGTGSEGYVLRIGHGGRPGQPVTITSAPGERARLHGIVYVTAVADHVTLSRLTIDARHPRRPARSQVGIQVLAGDTAIADSDITDHRVRSCVILTGRARRTVISGNLFHDCGDPANGLFDHAVYIAHSDRARITGNVFVRSAGWAVQLYPDARRTRVTGNLMWENGGAVIFGGEGRQASRDNLVAGNVMGASRTRAELTSSYGEAVGRGNLARGNCLAPGVAAHDRPFGFRLVANRVASGPACLATASRALVQGFAGVAPALVARLQR